MIVTCEKCGLRYDDVNWSTVCPHNGVDGVCRKHDLYNCPFHESRASRNDVRASEDFGTPYLGPESGE